MQKKIDKILFFTSIILSLFGIVMIYSASSIWAEYKFNDAFHYLKYQSIFFIVGVIIMLIVSKIDYKVYYEKSNLILSICIILLILVLIPGIGSIRNGSRSWFGIGPFGIQPSEAAKLGLIIFTSKYLSKSNKFLKSYKQGVFPILGITLLIFFLIMLQPDLGTGVILVMSIISLLFIAGVNMKFFLGIGILGIIGITILIIIAPYRMDRITSFINPWNDALGTGFLNSVQKHFYLPEPQTDFIFSIIAEEFGVAGAFIVTGLFSLILWRGIKIALNSKDLFSKYLSFGMIFQIIFQTLMNLMVVIGMIPVTGVTLPFLSYGGSSLLITCASIGILLNISKYQM